MNDREYYEQYGEMRHGYIPGLPGNDNQNEQVESYAFMKKRYGEVAQWSEKARSQIAQLEQENEYLMATLHDIQSGLDALNWHITVASGVPEYFDPNPAFLEAWRAIKITQTELRNIIEEWESRWVSSASEIPF
jgi:hypothetical protein